MRCQHLLEVHLLFFINLLSIKMLVPVLFFLPYLLLILAFIIGNIKLQTFKVINVSAKNTFSIVIPFRNEALNLPNLLQSLSQIAYPKNLYEIILVNDASEDNFENILINFKKQNPNINCLVLNAPTFKNASKKNALSAGIQYAKFNWIITTDADCMVSKNWLCAFNHFIEEKNPVFICGPVQFKKRQTFLFHFQNLNFLSLIGSTIGGFGIGKPILCNGANLCYKKSVFYELGGFGSNEAIASGDDIFLLEKFVQHYYKRTYFLKSLDVLVETVVEKNWISFLNQQLRWASKAMDYTNNFTKLIGVAVFFENLFILIIFLLVILQLISLKIFVIVFLMKVTVDFLLILKSSLFLKNTTSLKFYPIISIFYPFFIVCMALLSSVKTFSWKGRTFKK